MGRFAPTPSGDLHLGSLYAAAASYLEARSRGGRWLVRMEDVDVPRVVPGAAARILTTLEAFGFEWDGEVLEQSRRGGLYAAALATLDSKGLTFRCSCSRSQLADEDRYPGYCREGPVDASAAATAVRLRVTGAAIRFEDRIQGMFRQDVGAAVGDVVLARRDGLIAYLLAVVVDDADQGVTDVVRGADLLDNTPRQIYLQRCLGLEMPTYAHVPVLVEADGRKLAKSARSMSLHGTAPMSQLLAVFDLLGLPADAELLDATPSQAWAWACAHWRPGLVPRRLAQPLCG